jgi:hypothetical protein
VYEFRPRHLFFHGFSSPSRYISSRPRLLLSKSFLFHHQSSYRSTLCNPDCDCAELHLRRRFGLFSSSLSPSRYDHIPNEVRSAGSLRCEVAVIGRLAASAAAWRLASEPSHTRTIQEGYLFCFSTRVVRAQARKRKPN